MTGQLIGWSPATAAAFGRTAGKADHRLHEWGMFDDGPVAELLDTMPPDQLHAYTMGTDPADHSAWRQVATSGIRGADLLDAVGSGRLWLNILRVDQVDGRYAALADRIRAELSGAVPGFAPTSMSVTLLVSSPTAMVHYHADGQPNLLWHLRGRKRIWVYPALDERFLSARDLQRIFSGAADEFVPYRTEWDDHATVLDLEPGEVAWWPQNAPHRVANTEGVNVSLSEPVRIATQAPPAARAGARRWKAGHPAADRAWRAVKSRLRRSVSR